MRNGLVAILLSLLMLPWICGCGGGTSQAEMRKHALRRSSGDARDETAASSSARSNAAGGVSPSVKRPADREAAGGDEPVAGSPEAGVPAVQTAPPANPVQAAGRALPAASAVPGVPGVSELPVESAPARVLPPQSLEERRARSIKNLRTIGAAMQAYIQQNGSLPKPALSDAAGRPLLSWRVVLLPYLGLDDLYQRFHMNEPWDSPHNRTLVSQIPAVYRSPERLDEKTNYLLPRGAGTLFPPTRPVAPRRIEDGLPNTVLLLETDDVASIPWTQPVDYDVDFQEPCRALGNLRSDGFFVAWGDGHVARLESNLTPGQWRAIFTPDGGEPISAFEISRPATPAVPTSRTNAAAGTPRTQQAPRPQGKPNARSSGMPAPGGISSGNSPTGAAPPAGTRLLPPEPAVYEIALKDLRDAYRDDYMQAFSNKQKQALAEKLMSEATNAGEDGDRRFVALDLCRQIAADSGDVDLALDAIKRLEVVYEVDGLKLRTELLESSSVLALSDRNQEQLLREALRVVERAMAADRLDIGERANAAAIAAARRGRNGRLVALLESQRSEIKAAQDAFDQLADAIEVLSQNPDDADANLALGKYYCFVKRRWEEGWPLLLRGDDSRLAVLAKAELEPPGDPGQQVALGDRWWVQSERRPDFSQAMKQRATFWYSKALPGLPPGLDRMRAEMRIRLVQLPGAAGR